MATRQRIMKKLVKETYHNRFQHKPQNREAAKKTKWNILRGDTVQVISRTHPEHGKKGVILQVDRKRDRVVIEGLNLAPKHLKPNPDKGLPGKTILKERSLHYSNVNLVDPVTGYPTRVTRKYLEDGTKVRVAKQSGAIIPRPEILTVRKRPKDATVTESDTTNAEDVWEVTYVPLGDRSSSDVVSSI